jgi:YD repeat-containing protein
MKRIAAIIITATISSGALAAPLSSPGSTIQRDAPTTRFYDSRGNVTGSASTYGNTTKYYDARGNLTGSATGARR